MAGSVNKVILVGNLGKDPETRRTQDGRPIVHLSVATSDTWRDKNTGEGPERRERHGVVIARALPRAAVTSVRQKARPNSAPQVPRHGRSSLRSPAPAPRAATWTTRFRSEFLDDAESTTGSFSRGQCSHVRHFAQTKPTGCTNEANGRKSSKNNV